MTGRFSYRNINSCEGRQSCMLGRESFPVRTEKDQKNVFNNHFNVANRSILSNRKHEQERAGNSPGGHDGVLVVSRTDVFSDVSISVAGAAGQSVVGFTDSEEEWRVVTCRQLDDVSDQRRRTQTEHVHTCRDTNRCRDRTRAHLQRYKQV